MADKEYIERGALIENIKRVYCADCNSYDGVRCRACGTGDALDMIDDAPTADVAPRAEWIRVDERLPERWKYVIVCDECKDVGVARHLGNGHFEWTDDENIAFATHWMPLPEPPKGD